MLQAPEVAEASKYRSIAVGTFDGQYGDLVAKQLEAALMNAKVQDTPVYRQVVRAPAARSSSGDPRPLAAAAKAMGAEAIFGGEVTQASVNDTRSQREEYVCDRTENAKKLFSKCVSGHNQTVYCTERKANLQVQVRLIDAQSSNQVYAQAVNKSSSDSACGSNSTPTDGQSMLSALIGEAIVEIQGKVVPHDKVVSIELMSSTDGLKAPIAASKFEGALKFAREGRMDRGCAGFREIFDGEKNSVSLLYNLGVCEESVGAYWKADEYYRSADQLSSEPNTALTAALNRNAGNLKKADGLAKNRSDLISRGTIESGAAPQTISGKTAGSAAAITAASAAVPREPDNINPEILMLEKRSALVIGNGGYKRGALPNPVNDARAIAAELRQLNFKVIEVEDVGFSKMGLAVEEFGRAIQEGGVALVFYAGHGMQVKGENYLIPIDADLKSESDVPYKTVALGQILAKLEDAKPRVSIVMLDACRDNPFARSWRSTRGGLASVDAPTGTVIAYATAPGKTAADGSGANGLYTSFLLKQLSVPNQKIEDVLKNTRKAVATASNNQQVPWDSSSLTGDFYFKVSKQ